MEKEAATSKQNKIVLKSFALEHGLQRKRRVVHRVVTHVAHDLRDGVLRRQERLLPRAELLENGRRHRVVVRALEHLGEREALEPGRAQDPLENVVLGQQAGSVPRVGFAPLGEQVPYLARVSVQRARAALEPVARIAHQLLHHPSHVEGEFVLQFRGSHDTQLDGGVRRAPAVAVRKPGARGELVLQAAQFAVGEPQGLGLVVHEHAPARRQQNLPAGPKMLLGVGKGLLPEPNNASDGEHAQDNGRARCSKHQGGAGVRGQRPSAVRKSTAEHEHKVAYARDRGNRGHVPHDRGPDERGWAVSGQPRHNCADGRLRGGVPDAKLDERYDAQPQRENRGEVCQFLSELLRVLYCKVSPFC